jgi:acyl carrier protein
LSLGYVNDPTLTDRRFVVNPFTGNPRDVVYRSGDRGRYRPDGQVEFAGRDDGQVKIRGYRVELGEIEARLHMHPSVAQAVVVAREDTPGERRLVAYVVLRAGEEVQGVALRRELAATQPEYMIPSAFVVLDAMPLTANRKIDKRSLPDPGAQTRPSTGDAPPRLPTEHALADIWREVLRVEQVGVHDNFFDLGGHSLLATQLVSRVRQACGVEIPVRALFETPTIAGLAATVDSARRASQRPESVPLRPVSREARRIRLDAQGAAIFPAAAPGSETR